MDKRNFKKWLRDNGSNYYSSGNVRFFDSKLEYAEKFNDVIYFIDSTKQWDFMGHVYPRKYTVKVAALIEGVVDIEDVSKFQEFATLKDARNFLAALIELLGE